MYFFANFQSHRASQISYQNFFENSYFLAFKLVLQNCFHGLSFTFVRLLSGQCNFDLQLTASLRTLAINKLPPPPPKKKNVLIISVFSHCVLMSSTTKNPTDFVHFISFKLHHLTIIEEVLKIKST